MNRLLSNDIIALRPLEPTDLDILYRWENDSELWTVSDTPAPYSRKALWDYLETNNGDIYSQRQLRLMITLADGGTPVGSIDFLNFDPFNNRAELGLLVAKEYRGKGLGRQALELLTVYARDHIGLRQLYVYILTDNKVCINLFESFGYRHAGLLQAWVKRGATYHDATLMQMVF